MFSLSAVLIALLLVPTFLCTAILHLFFPKHTIKISDAHLFPFGLGFTLICNVPRIFKAIELLIPPVSIPVENREQIYLQHFVKVSGQLLKLYEQFVFVPVVIFFALMTSAYVMWRFWERNPNQLLVVRKTGEFVNGSLVSPIGRMTAFEPRKEALMVDVLDDSDTLYSGVYYDYFIEGKRFSGIRLSNVIRWSLKDESLRKVEKLEGSSMNSSQPYILPNDGLMYFPSSSVQNLHFWKIHRGQSDRIYLGKASGQTRFVWMIGLKYSLEHLQLDPIGFLFEDELDKDMTQIGKACKTMNIDPDLALANIDFEARHP